jgi:hypothetical protein
VKKLLRRSQNLKARKPSPRTPKVYSSIDELPVYLWDKVNSTGDLSYLLIKRKKITEKQRAALKKVMDKMHDEFIEEFGLSDSFKSITRNRIEIAQMKMQYVIEGDGSVLTFIEIAQQELDEQLKETKKVNFIQSKISIERSLKLPFQINIHTTSVKEFYTYFKKEAA